MRKSIQRLRILLLVLACALLGAAWMVNNLTKLSAKDDVVSEIVSAIRTQMDAVENEGTLLMSSPNGDWPDSNHAFFLFDGAEVTNWNDNQFVPEWRNVQGKFEWTLINVPLGVFLIRKWEIADSKTLIGLITLYDNYKISNKYLRSGWNEIIFPTQQVEITEVNSSNSAKFIYKGQTLFSFRVNAIEGGSESTTVSTLMLTGLGFALLMFSLFSILKNEYDRGNFAKVFLLILILLVGARLISLYALSPINLSLFNPSFFASSSYNRSVGDLLLNTILVFILCAYLFWNFQRFTLVSLLLKTTGWVRHMSSILLLTCCFFAFLFPYLFIETIFHNSSIALDIASSLKFDSLRLVSYFAIVLGSISSFILGHVLFRLAENLIGKRSGQFFIFLGVAAIAFLFYSELSGRNYLITIAVSIGYFSVVHFFGLTRHLRAISFSTFLYLLCILVGYAAQGALAIKRFSQEERTNAQFRFASNFLVDRDFLGEYLLDEAALRIANDPYVQTRISSPFLSKAPVRQKIRQFFLSSYFDRYEVQIHLFNAVGEPYDNSTTATFASLIQNFENEANKTNYERIYFIKNVSAESVKRYLAWIPVYRFNTVAGYIVLDLSLRRIIPQNVFPELLLDNRFSEYFKNRDFSYAFFAGQEIVSRFGLFNYDRDFSNSLRENESLYQRGVRFNEHYHVALEYEGDRLVVVSAPLYPQFYVLTNFSFLFSIGLVASIGWLLIYGLISLIRGEQLNYSARIQLYTYLAFGLPLLVVCTTTLGLINRSAESQLNNEFVHRSQVLGEQIAQHLSAYLEDTSLKSDLDNQLQSLTKLDNLDASIYSVNGKLVSTTQPVIYETGILSSLVSRSAWRKIVQGREQSLIASESIGNLTYNNAYYGLKSPESGALIGILSLPFFESAFSLEKTQINVLANILVIFCGVFLLFSLLSYFALRSLTSPLRFITKALGGTSLTSSNQPVEWRSKDEIGLMVGQYNKMLENLEQSKIELSRSQKESAWREIAKQVAHEIKNPLTPMKLTLQQMERSILSGELSPEKTNKSVKTLLTQLEILDEIAASFSAFARMPAPILQKIDLVPLLKKVTQLHSDYKEGEVLFKQQSNSIMVMGDQQLLSRVFSNIILNALQSGKDVVKVTVEITTKVLNRVCIVEFADNGLGIDKELKDKIFTPYFTTKKSGSGLGLAIAKQGIEQNGGRIDFNSNPTEGTIFRVELPLAN